MTEATDKLLFVFFFLLPRSHNEAIKAIPRLGKISQLSKQTHRYPFAEHFRQEERVDNFFHGVQCLASLCFAVWIKWIVKSQCDTVHKNY